MIVNNCAKMSIIVHKVQKDAMRSQIRSLFGLRMHKTTFFYSTSTKMG